MRPARARGARPHAGPRAEGTGRRTGRRAVRPVSAEVRQAIAGLGDVGSMPGRHPPHRRRRLLHQREPLAALLVDLEMRARVGEGAQRLDRQPDRHVHDDLVVVVDRHRGGVVGDVVLEPPDEAWRALGERVHFVEPVDEPGELRRVERRDQARDVHLGQMEGGSHAFNDNIETVASPLAGRAWAGRAARCPQTQTFQFRTTPTPPSGSPSFRHYLTGNFVFLVGLQMQKVALGWEIYERTGSALHLGYVGLAQFAPQLVLAPFGGHTVDAYNRKKVLFIALGVSLLASLGLALDSLTPAPLWVFYLLLVVVGSARSFWMPARSAILPRLVPSGIFRNAVSWNSSFFELASIGGPALGGLLIGLFHRGAPIYLFNVAAALTFILLVSRLQLRPRPAGAQRALVGVARGGLPLPAGTRGSLLAAMLLDTFAVLLGGATALMPVYAKDILHVGPHGLGWLLAAPSLGAVSAAFLQAHLRPWTSAGRTLLAAVAGYGVVTIAFGLSTNLWLSLGLLVLLGAFDNISVVLRGTLVQVLTPDAMRGRVSALNGLFIGTSNELGAFESGTVAQFFGPVVSVVSGGIGTLLVGCARSMATRRLPRS